MGLFKQLFSRASPVCAARTWLSTTSARDFLWADLGELVLPSGGLFVGDPTGGHDYHMRATATTAASRPAGRTTRRAACPAS